MPDDAMERARECLALQWEKAGRPGAAYIARHEPDEITEIHVAAMLAFASQQAPGGWRLVPIAPTDAMIEAAGGACISLERADDPSYEPAEVWSAMLDASPSVGVGV